MFLTLEANMNSAKDANHPLRLASSTNEPKQAPRPGVKRRLKLVEPEERPAAVNSSP